MRMTAEKSVASPQFEVLLKVKQADNEEFAFLREGNALLPYYLYLKQTLKKDQSEVHDTMEGKAQSRDTLAQGGLVNCYSSSDDEADSEMNPKGTPVVGKLVASYSSSESEFEGPQATDVSIEPNPAGGSAEQTEPLSSTDEPLDDAIKARRLKRARLLKGHFALKMMEK